MSSKLKSHPGGVLARLSALVAVFLTFAFLAAAQEPPAPKWEIYGGYSFLDPATTIHGQLPGALLPISSRLESNPRGVGADLTYNFNHWFGLTLDTSINSGSGEVGLANRIDDAAFANLSFGPKITFRHKHVTPFFEVLVGDHRLSPDAFHDVSKLGVMFGGGLDINLTRHVALRLIRADYVFSTYRYTPPNGPNTDITGVRLQSGLNFMFGGGAPPPPPTAACAIQPADVFAGESVTVTATGSNFNPKRTVKYSWNATGVKVSGSDSSAQIDTTGLQPGSYAVGANLSDGSKNGSAICSANFTVKEPRPPVISCSADPSSVRTGGTSTIHSTASSPDGRRLAFNYAASAGEISGTSDTATLDRRAHV